MQTWQAQDSFKNLIFGVRWLSGLLHVQRDLKIHSEAMDEVYELLEVSIFIDSKGKLAEWLSLALHPETGRVGETDGGLLSLASVRDVALI